MESSKFASGTELAESSSQAVQDKKPSSSQFATIEIPELTIPEDLSNYTVEDTLQKNQLGLNNIPHKYSEAAPLGITINNNHSTNNNNNNNNTNINNITNDIDIDYSDAFYGKQPMAFKLGGDISTSEPRTPVNQTFPSLTSPMDNFQKRLSTRHKTYSPNYTLNIIVRQFTKYAERKLNVCLNSCPLDQEPNIIEFLSEGVDPMFDRTISSLGYIARRTPKRVTDAVMHWRRGKSELREMARSILEKDMIAYQESLTKKKHIHSHRKTMSRPKVSLDGNNSLTESNNDSSLKELEQKVQKSEITFTQADRQFTISTYILWRVLIEVIKQTPSSTLMEDTGLEEIMYNYLRSIDPYLVSRSIIHSANWNLLSELIGYMSEKSFLSVSDRFIADLEKFPTGYTNESSLSEASLNLLIHSMRYLQFSNASLERFEEGADFIKSLAKFFYKCENENIFISYCEVINQLLLCLAGTLTAEVNHPTWVDAIKVIYSKSLTIVTSKPAKYWRSAITLAVTALAVAPKEMFESKWMYVADMITKKLKPKVANADKIVVVTCISRLTWAYLYRYSDTLNAKTRNMELLASSLFLTQQNKKQQWLSDDPLLIQATVQILRAMAFSQLNFTLENIFLPFLKSAFNGLNLDGLSHERMLLAIRSYCCILWDYQQHERPPFPTDDVIHNSLDPLEFCNTSVEDVFDMNSSNAQVHEEVSGIFQKIMFLLESQCGCRTLDPANPNMGYSPSTPSSISSAHSFHQRLSSFTYFHTEDNGFKNAELFSTVISSITWCANVTSSGQYRKIVELLVKNCINESENTSQFCIDALKILITKKNPNVITTIFATTAFFLDEKTTNFLKHDYLSSDEFIRLLEVYVEILQSWLESITDTEEESAEKANSLYNVNHGFVQEEIHESKTFEDLELKNMITIIDDVEGNGLFFLFSHDFRVRYLGSQILRVVTQFDEVIYDLTTNETEEYKKTHNRMPSKFVAEFGTRIIEVLGSLDFFEFINNKKHLLSEAESKRYNKLQHQDKKNTIIKLAESSHGVDAALWFKIFEEILEALVKKCPIQIAITRSHSCIRLVQLYDQVVAVSSGNVNGTGKALIWDYMLYLKIACASLTSTSEQRLHIPDLNTPVQPASPSIYSPLVKGHNRKKSQQMFTVQHQKITSAKSIFRMTVPLLTTSNSKLKDALVEGLSCLNVNIFKTFMQSIDSSVEKWELESHSGKTLSSDMRLRVEVCCILNKVIGKFTKTNEKFLDEWVLRKLITLLENMKRVLVIPSCQISYKFQRLRKYFCGLLETLHIELLKVYEVDKWLSFDFRRNSFEFMIEWTGYGAASSIFAERYSFMKKDVASQDDSLSLQASLEMQKHQLQYSAISCMASLCGSPICTEGENFNFGKVLDWLDALFKTYNEKISGLARKALLDILTVNSDAKNIFDMVIKKCYTHDVALGNYFITLKDAFLKGVNIEYPVYRILALALFSSGSDNYNVRAAASTLLEFIEMKYYGTNQTLDFVDGVCCRSRIIYKRTLFQLSSYFASTYSEEKFKMISELTMLFNWVGSGPRRDVIAVLLPWVQNVDLKLGDDDPDRDNCLAILSNFFDITMKFSHKIQNEIEALWVALGSGDNGNAKEIYNFIVTNSLALKNLAFIECSRQVIVSMSTIPGEFNLVDTLISNIDPKSFIPFESKASSILITESDQVSIPDLPYVANLSKLIRNNSSTTIPSFSLCELSIVFLVDLILTPNESIRENLSLLLHLSFVLLDHQLSLVQDQASALMIHLIHQFGKNDSEHTKKIVESLRAPDYAKNLWVYSDLTSDDNGGRIPENMDSLIRNVLTIFEIVIPTIQKDWSTTAIKWATTCKVMHIASRSFQVFRCLISFLDQGMLRDMLSCLANTISDENPGIQSFSMQILMTLNAITAELYSEQLIAFPQLFWSAVASLNTIHEQEFIEVLSTLSKFVSKIDFNSEDTVNCLIATFPPKWEGHFEGLQKTIMIGLRSSNAYEPTLKLLGKLNQLADSQVIGAGKHRVLMVLLTNMPRFLHAHTTKRFSDDVIKATNVLGEMADKTGIVGLSRIVESLVKRRFRNKEDFLNQIVNVLERFFFPMYAAEVLIFLLGLLFNKISWIKIEIMDLLKHVFRAVDLTGEEFVGLGADLVAPLLRLLLTEYVDQALEVLDETTAISASPFDKHYLMMSAGDSTMRKEYEKVATLFGIPDESGWSVPMPAVSTAITRNNIHSVYSTCVLAVTEKPEEQGGNVEEVVEEVEKDNEQRSVPSQFDGIGYVQYNPLSPELQQQVNRHHQQQEHHLITDTASVDEGDRDSLSNMLATLENLDSFFTKDSMELPENYGHQYNSSVDTKSTATTSATDGNWGLNFDIDSPKIEQSIQFESTASFKTLLADVNTPSTNNGLVTSPFRNSAKFRRKSSHVSPVEPLQLSRDLSKDSMLGSPLSSGSPKGESDSMFGFDILRQTNKTRRRSSRINGSFITSDSRASPRSPRAPRTPRTPLSPYGKSKFSRNYTAYKRTEIDKNEL